MQTPIVKIGTEFPAGKVVAIEKSRVLLETPEGVKQLHREFLGAGSDVMQTFTFSKCLVLQMSQE